MYMNHAWKTVVLTTKTAVAVSWSIAFSKGIRLNQEHLGHAMDAALRLCIAQAICTIHLDPKLRFNVVQVTQRLLDELFQPLKTDSRGSGTTLPGRFLQPTTMALSNASILADYSAFKTGQHTAHLARLRAAHPKLSAFTDEELTALYQDVVSCFQSKGGKFFEGKLEGYLREAGVPFRAQVHIDSNGYIVEGRSDGDTIPDLVFGNPVVGTHISGYVVMSLKTTSRERAKLDTAWTCKHPPKLFLYGTLERDYPSPKTFCEGPTRKMVCAAPRTRDARKFKLKFEDLVAEIQAALA